jgi:arylsulfatase A-like enzyme
MSETDHRAIRAAYWAMCDLVDEMVGSLLDVLEETGQRGNTVVVFQSDHGELLGDHGMYTKGSFLYDASVRVPLVVSWPGRVSEGLRAGGLVELIDIAPSLLEAAGLEVPDRMQARSLWPVLTGGADPDPIHDDVYAEHYGSTRPGARCTMVRTRSRKLIARHGEAGGELYDLEADPAENVNLWDDPGSRAVKLEMFERLADAMARTVDPMPPHEAPW